MARRRVGVRRTRQPSILVGTVGARRAERTCVVRPRVAGVADAAQHAVGEVGEACRVAGTRFALIKSRICPHWPVGTGAAVCTACLALRSLELASSTGFTGPPCVVKPARKACVARAVRRGVVLQAPRRVRRTLRARTRGRRSAVVLPGAREARDVVRHLALVRACLARQTRWKCNLRYEAAATEIASLRRINAVDCE